MAWSLSGGASWTPKMDTIKSRVVAIIRLVGVMEGTDMV
jgi:hypothetical protein